jgi:hypothetical protein
MPLKQSISLFDLDLLFVTTISLVYRSSDRVLPHIGYAGSGRISQLLTVTDTVTHISRLLLSFLLDRL